MPHMPQTPQMTRTTTGEAEKCLSPLASNPQSGTQSALVQGENDEPPRQRTPNHVVTNIDIGQDEAGTKTRLLNFQIQVPPHDEMQILNICVFQDDGGQESTFQTDDRNLKMVVGNPTYGIKVSVSRQ